MVRYLDYHNLRFTTRCIRSVLVSVVAACTSEIHTPVIRRFHPGPETRQHCLANSVGFTRYSRKEVDCL